MAKKSWIEKGERRQELTKRHAANRRALTQVVKDPEASWEDKLEAQRRIEKLPRDSSATRIRLRCRLTGRSRSYMRAFGLSRMIFRELALEGKLPGVKKTSW
ncbi:MAG: 30S ribosomal protein S14 [Candidatus Babeliales bacterium]